MRTRIMGLKDSFGIWARAIGRGVFPHQMTWILDLPGRGLIMSAKTVATRLPIQPDAQVLEVGPGSGYCSIEVARRVPNGHLHLLDIQQGMLDKSAAKLKAAGVAHFSTYLLDGQTLPFADGSLDAIFLVTVLGEIEAQNDFMSEACRVLKPGGVLSVTEHHPDPDFESSYKVRNLAKEHGFVPLQLLGWRWAYTLNLAAMK